MAELPTALHKAESLGHYMSGAPDVETTFLTLTDREAWAFLKWYRTQLDDRQCFDREMRRARAFRNPWPVLEGMRICGFQVIRADYEDTH